MNHNLDLSFNLSVSGKELLNRTASTARANWLTNKLCRDDLFFLQDGPFSEILLNEIFECFLAGRDIATIVIGFSFIERTIAGRLNHTGHPKAQELKSEQLLAEAIARGWISQSEHENLTEIRKLRNPIVHFKDYLHAQRPEIRALTSALTTKEMMERDAKQVLESVIKILYKTAL